jgi:hypothetical protein
LDNLGLAGIGFAGAWGGLSRPETLLAQPVGHRSWVEGQDLCNLRHLESVGVMQVFDLTKLVIINHDNTSQICWNTA